MLINILYWSLNTWQGGGALQAGIQPRNIDRTMVQETLKMQDTAPSSIDAIKARSISSKHMAKGHLLADEQDVNGAQVEVVEEGQGSKSVICWMLARIKLKSRSIGCAKITDPRTGSTYHYGLALVLNDMT